MSVGDELTYNGNKYRVIYVYSNGDCEIIPLELDIDNLKFTVIRPRFINEPVL
ncbi:hypothetical protein GJU40_18125 [Bacillus lacus]|uniref:Uncharacterized protein n=1 Tax=Metabacillus lacus TaxID=1983721 RepID=A0A7X2J221_9BACI|nr:hypothetical protein [Metabacillus lacus]MRX74043.1 hypothetical protein [Metabacillus lacus]